MNLDYTFIKDHIFQIARFIFAIIMIFFVARPLALKGVELLSRNFKDLIPPDTANNTQEDEMHSLWVRIYGFQLAAWAAMLGMSLWAIVSLCRSN